jgi:EAL domain-containing protein (putative c-di-GMP-specific phosphodiesterase class I)/GGDEF domain-containing protein
MTGNRSPKFSIYALLVLTASFLSGCSAGEQPAFRETGVTLSDPWTCRFSASSPETGPGGMLPDPVPAEGWSETTASNFPRMEATPWLWLRTRLPQLNYREPMLIFGNVAQCFDLFLDGRKIYSYGKPGEQLSLYATHEVLLPDNCAGAEITFVVTSSLGVIGVMDPVVYGSRGGLFLLILRQEGFTFIVSMFFIICALILLPFILNRSYIRLFMWFSIFSLGLGCYLISRLHLKDFIFPGFTSWGYAELLLLYIMTFSFIQFLRFSEVFPSRYFLPIQARLVSVVLPVLLAVTVFYPNILQMALIPWNVYLLVITVYFMSRSVHVCFVPAPVKTKVFAVSMIIFSVFVIHDILVSIHLLPWEGFWMVPGLIIIFLALLFIIRENLLSVFRESVEKSTLLKKSFDEVTSLNEKLSQKLMTDDFTGLPNRNQLEIDLKDGTHDLLILDIRGFSGYNIGYGTEVGNRIILRIAERLKQFSSGRGKLYRLASDEFIIDLETGGHIVNFTEALLNHFRSSHLEVDGLFLYVQFSAGILVQEEGNLLQKANIALKSAKEHFKGRYAVFKQVHEEDVHSHYLENIQWTKKIREAIDGNRIIPYFQGIHDNKSGLIDKYECLMRMEDDGKIITPYAFLDVARHSGAMKELTAIMMEKCFRFFSGRTEEFSINLEEDSLDDENLYMATQILLQKYGIDPGRVTYELVEGIEVKSAGYLDMIRRLKKLGVKIAIDDFGTAYSNFSRLLDMHVDYIKIDGSLVRSIDSNPDFFKVVHGIKSLADNIHAAVIAEFVHNDKVQAKILDLGIEFSQGYFFSEPDPGLKSQPG